MQSHAEVVVIGGGVVGCSVLFHLARAGCREALLIERGELTCGSSWHAAGGMHMLNGDPNVAGLQKYTMDVMAEIESLSGRSCGVRRTGALLLAGDEDRLDWLRMLAARARFHGVDQRLLSPGEARELLPILNPEPFAGALLDPMTAHVDPSGVTHAYAKAAESLGARVHLRNRVVDTRPAPGGGWKVVTEAGALHAEHVVNAGGLWAREVGRMAGVELPVLAMEHHYILTEGIPAVVEQQERTGRELLHITDFPGELYGRQERDGLLIGTYERACVPWSEQVTPWDFGPELLPPDLDRILPSLEIAFEHFPALREAGIREIVNGPFTFAPDGNPLMGPVRGLPGYWVAAGVMAGFSQAGGVGWALANWILHGDPGEDVWGMDVARFGEWATPAYTRAKVCENYARRFRIRYPNEELPAGRPLRTVPIHDLLAGAGAVTGESGGVEVPLWYAPPGVEDRLSFRRSADFAHVGAESRAVREGVGIADISGFAKYEVVGEGAAAWLDRVLAGRLPPPGRIALTPMLGPEGRILGDFTTANLGDGRFQLVGAGAAESCHMRWFLGQDPSAAGAHLHAWGLAWTGLALAGPKSRKVLQSLVSEDVSNAAFPFLAVRCLNVGATPCRVGRISYTGDLGYELWCPAEFQRRLYLDLAAAGRPHGIRHFGARAMNGLRLEKAFGSWAREYRPTRGPVECGLDRLIDFGKPNGFVGRDAAARERETGGELRLRLFAVDVEDVDALGDEPIRHDGAVRGRVTSGGFAHMSGLSLALGFVPKELAHAAEGWEIEIVDSRRRSELLTRPPFDPDGLRMRS